jgi:hypothetical protein
VVEAIRQSEIGQDLIKVRVKLISQIVCFTGSNLTSVILAMKPAELLSEQ